jgi:DNA polymerase
MPDIVHIDYESFSKIDLSAYGAYRYAADPSARILMMGIALNDQEPRILLPLEVLEGLGLEQDSVAMEWALKWYDGVTPVYAHNAGFEIAVTKYRMVEDFGLVPPKLTQWRCTAALARKAALPAKLETLADTLQLPQRKDKRGSALIKIFCELQGKGKKKGQRIYPWDDPKAFNEFIEYCKQDVRTEQAVHKKLAAFDLKGQSLRVWQLDCKINDRGVPVNVTALENTKVIVDECQRYQGDDFREITGLNYTQREKVLNWLRERGYPYDDMQATSVARAIEDNSWAKDDLTKQAIQLKADLSYSAVSKVGLMLNCNCGDGLVRGTLVFHGAGPGRWAGRLIQPQNLKRPTFPDTASAYQALCEGSVTCADDMRLLFGSAPLDVIASCIRHYIQLAGNRKMYDADYAAIEARIVCWLAGQEDALERFRKYDATGSKEYDPYVRMACVIFKKIWSEVLKDERWLGKQTVLGCGFQMGHDKFFDQCIINAEKYNIKGIAVTKPLAVSSVASFREEYNHVQQLWWDTDRAARNAILNPGKVFKAGPKISFVVVNSSGIPYLVLKLPSGRNIVYPWPALEKDPKKQGKTKITYFGKLPKSSFWGRVSTYGGKLVENATQGTAADVMGCGACNADDLGFDVITLIHDQALAVEDGRPAEEFAKALTDLPSWADGLPVAAECDVVPYYLKL